MPQRREFLACLIAAGWPLRAAAARAFTDLDSFDGSPDETAPSASGARWWKGNLHVHSLWSDGSDFPEVIAAWYKRAGYHFLAFSEHDRPPEGRWWKPVGAARSPEERLHLVGVRALERCRAEFGAGWLEEVASLPEVEWAEVERSFPRTFAPALDWLRDHRRSVRRWVRVKALGEFRSRLEEPGRYLLLPSQEIHHGVAGTSCAPLCRPWVNAANTAGPVEPGAGDTPFASLQATLDRIAAHGRATGRPVLASLNHPNYEWGTTAEDLARTEGLKLIEIYTGAPSANNEGDALHAGAERIWDIVLTLRLAELNKPLIYGIATDDYHALVPAGESTTFGARGWVMVRSRALAAEALFAAMARGDFYASTGVDLEATEARRGGVALAIRPKPGVRYRTQFIGTTRGYDPRSEEVRDEAGDRPRTTRRYSPEVGRVLAEAAGTHPSYRFTGREIYVRARVLSSEPYPATVGRKGFAAAWTQPVVPE